MEGLKINVQAALPVAIRKMESRSHPISVELGVVTHRSFAQFAAAVNSDEFDPTKARASLADSSAILDRDFVLHLQPASREFLQSRAVAKAQPHGSECTVAVTINPGDLFIKNASTEKYTGELVFIVDRSGSMESKIPALRNVVDVFLRSLPEACSFNIGSFGSDYSWLWDTSRSYSQGTMDIATRHASMLEANMGGTEILQVLQSAVERAPKDIPTDIILLTDGEVWDVSQVIQFVRSSADSKVRFFALGIGDQVSHRLVEGIGQQGGGYAEVITDTSTGMWQGRVIQMLKAALTPSRLHCQASLSMPAGETMAQSPDQIQRPACIQAPYHIPVLNPWSNFSLYYMVQACLSSLPDTVTITATAEHGDPQRGAAPNPVHGQQPHSPPGSQSLDERL